MYQYILGRCFFKKKKKEVFFLLFFYLKKSYEIKKIWIQYFLNYMKYKMYSYFFKEFEIKSLKLINFCSKYYSNLMVELVLK